MDGGWRSLVLALRTQPQPTCWPHLPPRVAHTVTIPEQKLLLLTVLAERPELLGLNSRLSSSEKGDSEAGETLLCGCCWSRLGRRIKRGIRLLETSFSWCCTLCSFSRLESQKKTIIFLPAPARLRFWEVRFLNTQPSQDSQAVCTPVAELLSSPSLVLWSYK